MRRAPASASSTDTTRARRGPARATCTTWCRPRPAGRPPRGAGRACAGDRSPAARRRPVAGRRVAPSGSRPARGVATRPCRSPRPGGGRCSEAGRRHRWRARCRWARRSRRRRGTGASRAWAGRRSGGCLFYQDNSLSCTCIRSLRLHACITTRVGTQREGTPRRSAPRATAAPGGTPSRRRRGRRAALTRHQPAPATAQHPARASRHACAAPAHRPPSVVPARRTPAASRSTLLLVLVCMAQFMIVLDISIVNVALPSIRSALGFSTTGLQWVVNAYTLTFAGFLLLGGRAADLLGRRRMFLVGTRAFSLASLVCAAASSRGLLIGARALQGVSGAVVSPATLAILTTSFADGPSATARWGSGARCPASAPRPGRSSAACSPPPRGGRRSSWSTCRSGCSWSSARPAGLIAESRGDGAAPLRLHGRGARHARPGRRRVRDRAQRHPRLGRGGRARADRRRRWHCSALFAFVEHRVARAPLVPLSIFRRPQLRAANLVVLLLYGALFSTFFFVTLYMQQVLRYSPLQAGLGFLPMTLGVFVASNSAPRVIARLGARRTVTLGMLFAAAGLACFTGVHPRRRLPGRGPPGQPAVGGRDGPRARVGHRRRRAGRATRTRRPGLGPGQLLAFHRRRPRPRRAEHARRRAHPHRAARPAPAMRRP